MKLGLFGFTPGVSRTKLADERVDEIEGSERTLFSLCRLDLTRCRAPFSRFLVLAYTPLTAVYPNYLQFSFSVRSTASKADNLRRKEERHEQTPGGLSRRS